MRFVVCSGLDSPFSETVLLNFGPWGCVNIYIEEKHDEKSVEEIAGSRELTLSVSRRFAWMNKLSGRAATRGEKSIHNIFIIVEFLRANFRPMGIKGVRSWGYEPRWSRVSRWVLCRCSGRSFWSSEKSSPSPCQVRSREEGVSEEKMMWGPHYRAIGSWKTPRPSNRSCSLTNMREKLENKR